MKKVFLLMCLCFLAGGCSKQDWLAKFYIFKAENIYFKANYTMKNHKAPYAERQKFYKQACAYYFKAYEMQKSIFNLAMIESAFQSCLAVEDAERSGEFREFEDVYIQKHPKEYEYGDLGGGELSEM